MTIILFGQLTELAGAGQLEVPEFETTAQLIGYVNQQYPALQRSQYAIAVDRDIICSDTSINSGSVVALLPPYSGG